MLVNLVPLLKKASENKYAVAHINMLNLEWAKATLEVARDTHTPVIVALTDAVSTYFGGYAVMSDLIRSLIKNLAVDVDVAIHLDHGSYEGCLKCIDAGFTSIMFDGSKLSLDENIKKTSELVKLSHDKGMSIEAEVGAIGGTEDGIVGRGEIADPNDCKTIASLGIDALACGIGNIHGKYPENWEGLSFDILTEIKETVNDTPLVLHGGSGIPVDMIKKAISLGITKINVNTELHLAFCDATRKYFEAEKDKVGKGYDIRNISKDGIDAIKYTVKNKFEIFGSLGKG